MLFYLGLDPLKWALMWCFNEEGFRDRRSKRRRRVSSTYPTTTEISLSVSECQSCLSSLAACGLQSLCPQ